MATVEVTADNFAVFSTSTDVILIEFGDSCASCEPFSSAFARASERHADKMFGTVDTSAHPELAAAFRISAVPTLLIVRDQIVLYAQAGGLCEPALEDLIARVRTVDMDDVRQK